MKKFLFVFSLLISLFANSQGDRLRPVYDFKGLEISDWYFPPTNYVFINQRYRWFMGMFDSGFQVPVKTSNHFSSGQWTGAGAMLFNSSDSTIRYWTGYQWLAAGGSGGSTTTGSTTTILNDSTIEVCDENNNCDTLVFSDVDAQHVFVVNDTTLLVCNVDNTVCDTIVISSSYFDRGFFDPDQASFASTTHTMNGNDLNLIGGTINITDDGLAINTSSVITPLQAVNNHTDLNTVKIGAILSRQMVGAGAAGAGITLRSSIDNASSNQITASDLITKWITATAGAEDAEQEFWAVKAGTLRKWLSYNANTNLTTIGDFGAAFNGTLLKVDDANQKITTNKRFTPSRGSDVASTGDLTLGFGGISFVITGTTQINAITDTHWQDGSLVVLFFNDVLTVKHNTSGGAGTIPILLAGSEDLITDVNTVLTLIKNGSNWEEIGRKASTVAGNIRLNQIKAANGTNTINNANFAQEWQWNTLAGVSGLKLSSTSTAAASSNQKILELALSGANANSGQNTYGIYSSNTHTGSGAVNKAIFGTASGGSLNYGVQGSTSSSLGAGVQGSSTGAASGIEGSNNSSGAAVFGTHSGTGTAGLFAHSGASGTKRTLWAQNTGAATANIGAQFEASGATNNYALLIPDAKGRVGIGTETPSAQALLELVSTSQALLIMRMTATQASAITAADGMMLYVTDTNGTFTAVGFWGRENGVWVKL